MKWGRSGRESYHGSVHIPDHPKCLTCVAVPWDCGTRSSSILTGVESDAGTPGPAAFRWLKDPWEIPTKSKLLFSLTSDWTQRNEKHKTWKRSNFFLFISWLGITDLSFNWDFKKRTCCNYSTPTAGFAATLQWVDNLLKAERKKITTSYWRGRSVWACPRCKGCSWPAFFKVICTKSYSYHHF